jgi:uncharacterized protein YqeY
MNTLENTIQKDLVQAIKHRQDNAISALRFVKTAIMETKTAANGKKDLDDSDIVKIIQKLVKQRKESMDIYSQAGRYDLADNEQKEMFVLMNYLPKMLTESEVEEIVAKTIADLGATSMKDMGKVMGFINKTYAGQVDGSMVSRIVKSKLG